MGLSVAITYGNDSASPRASKTSNFTVAVTNTGSSAVTLNSLSINCGGGDARITQPNYLTPNVPVGVGNPILNAAAVAYYSFQAVFDSPYDPGPSPQNPGGASPYNQAGVPDPYFLLQAQAQSSDGSTAVGTLLVPVLSTIGRHPLPEGGALSFTQGSNLITLTMLGAL